MATSGGGRGCHTWRSTSQRTASTTSSASSASTRCLSGTSRVRPPLLECETAIGEKLCGLTSAAQAAATRLQARASPIVALRVCRRARALPAEPPTVALGARECGPVGH